MQIQAAYSDLSDYDYIGFLYHLTPNSSLKILLVIHLENRD